MNVLRHLAAIGALAAVSLLPSAARADMLDDFVKLFDDVSTNYAAAIAAGPDSRIADDYGKKIDELSTSADRIQNFITRLKIEDVNLRGNVNKLKDVFHERLDNKGRGQGKSHSLEGTSGRWFPTSLIRQDINKLREMGFTTDNGGSYKKKLVKADGFDEFDNLVTQYAKAVREVSDDPTNSEWRLLFERRLARMKVLASEIQVKMARELPAEAKATNFVSEVNFLDKFYKDLVIENDKIQSAKKLGSNYNGGSSGNTNTGKNKNKVYDDTSGRTKTVTEIDRIMGEISYTLKHVQDGVVKLKTLGFTLEGKLTREAKEKDTSSAEPEVSKDIAAMSVEELSGAIQRERDRIYKANVNMDGINPVVTKYYIKTLTKSQRTAYQDLVQKYQRRSWGGDAAGMALKEIHGRLKNEGTVSESKADLAKILENALKDKAQFEKDIEKERYSQLNR